MPKYIDADEMALKELEAYMYAKSKIENPITLGLGSVVHRKIQQLIAVTPAVDAVEVVRCKDCKRCFSKRTVRKKQLMRFCMRMDGNEFQVNANDFCSYGERK